MGFQGHASAGDAGACVTRAGLHGEIGAQAQVRLAYRPGDAGWLRSSFELLNSRELLSGDPSPRQTHCPRPDRAHLSFPIKGLP